MKLGLRRCNEDRGYEGRSWMEVNIVDMMEVCRVVVW